MSYKNLTVVFEMRLHKTMAAFNTILAGRSHPKLAQDLAARLNFSMVGCAIKDFANTEITTPLQDSVRGKNVFVIQTGAARAGRSVNDHLMELNLLLDGCRRSQAASITVIVPCLPYARSDKKDARGPIAAKLVIDQIFAAGANRLVALDIHAGQEQGFTNNPFDNLYGINIIVAQLQV